jgi:molybdate transport system substrate-binding protein
MRKFSMGRRSMSCWPRIKSARGFWPRRSKPGSVDAAALDSLAADDFRWLAIANPELAPYGAAAAQTLEAAGSWHDLQARIVRGQNVAQTFALVETGNADLGLVALAQALAYEGEAAYSIVPAELHDPIRQDAVLLRRAEQNAAALGFMSFLASPTAAAIIIGFGYLTEDP